MRNDINSLWRPNYHPPDQPHGLSMARLAVHVGWRLFLDGWRCGTRTRAPNLPHIILSPRATLVHWGVREFYRSYPYKLAPMVLWCQLAPAPSCQAQVESHWNKPAAFCPRNSSRLILYICSIYNCVCVLFGQCNVVNKEIKEYHIFIVEIKTLPINTYTVFVQFIDKKKRRRK